jgi:hypothetical protein
MAAMVGIFFLTLALFMISIIRAEEVTAYSGMPFYNLIFGAVHLNPILDRIIALVFMMLLGYMLIRMGARFVLLPIRSFMPALFFILFSAALSEARQVSPALVGSVFYLFCFAILFDVNDNPSKTFSVFTASLVLVLGSMFYLKLIWFIPVIWISLVTLKSISWRELFYPVLTFLLLGLLLFTWYWGVLDQGSSFVELISNNLAFEKSEKPLLKINHFSVLIYYGFILLLVLAASIYMITRFQSRRTAVQKIYQVLFYMFIAGLLFFTLIASFEAASLVYIAIPVSYLLSLFFHRKQNPWTHELIMWILLGLLVFVQWMV